MLRSLIPILTPVILSLILAITKITLSLIPPEPIQLLQATTPESVTKKVLVLNFDPIVFANARDGNQRLHRAMGWNDPHALTDQFIADIRTASGGFVNYQVVQWQDLDVYPVKSDGFTYTDETYLDCWNDHSTCHKPDIIDYQKMLIDYQVCEQLNAGTIDELWLFGAPWFGYAEANMAGPDAFNLNGAVVTNTTCQKQLPMMGFSYERSEARLLEDFGHRVEGTMTYVFGSWELKPTHAWNRFTMIDKDFPGQSGCGNVHFPPNGKEDYDFNNELQVMSSCDDWLNYPNLTGASTSINCTSWNPNIDCFEAPESGGYYLRWWLKHLPRVSGVDPLTGKLNNWWFYIIDYQMAKTQEVNIARLSSPSTNIKNCSDYGKKLCRTINSCRWLNDHDGCCLPAGSERESCNKLNICNSNHECSKKKISGAQQCRSSDDNTIQYCCKKDQVISNNKCVKLKQTWGNSFLRFLRRKLPAAVSNRLMSPNSSLNLPKKLSL
ncbi:MAG: hypothetical protein UV54_C0043G0016 [Candidatus Beckwithbacteria bacterium GW2011_GWA2_43_10]|uniref:Uncharacterized protein n=1 Tax=Candidatus Beckwithbacteria bacterium GW2011_GWA2_43_10 TaxID=1618369 RepID=A0A0G1C0C3_9BACT|nr:MAG: hypothetical protein UV54_C0043G0016 [Candidatus Beckwithbacteria bacterium GW2011_GWA2_43_10]